MPNNHAVLFITGATASGKSTLAMMLAESLNGVIINADSMQVYKDLPLLTAQPREEDRSVLPHELYGVLERCDTASAAWWRKAALKVIEKTIRDHKLPIIVGGTGFYFKALESGLSPIPEIPLDMRNMVRSLQVEEAFQRLKTLDPDTASTLFPGDRARVARALEVFLTTGKSIKEWHKKTVSHLLPYRFYKILMSPPRSHLKERANCRLKAMVDRGALEELSLFLNDPNARSYHIYKALGAPEFDAFLRGTVTFEEALTRAQTSTHQYIKRQETWFRHQIQPHTIIDEFPELFTMHRFKKVLKEINDHLNCVMCDEEKPLQD